MESQTAAGEIHREYHKSWSPRLERDMELLVFGHAGPKVLVFPTRGGRFYEYEDMRMTQVLAPKLRAGELQLFCIDGIDSESLYCWWAHPSGRIRRHIQYESYVIQEVFPFMEEKNPDPCVIAHGCSLGAFHATNIAFRHPNLFKKLVAFSGRYDLTLSVENFDDLFGGFYDKDIYEHTPSHFMPHLSCDWRMQHLRAMEMIFTVGAEDPFLGNNQELSRVLHEKGIAHSLFVWSERAHSGRSWRQMAAIYL